ncbi:phosphatase PAP2 family protein, partial [Patescibacteria group bacterium]|nr:phosphatase PAP2 family protein [Patescibacteria group bacterium]
FGKNFTNVFRGRNVLWHVAAAVLTFLLAMSGFDWFYFEHTRNAIIWSLAIPATALGGVFPVLIPLILLIAGSIRQCARTLNWSYALAQSAGIAAIIASIYKGITGRIHPVLSTDPLTALLGDTSRVFHFGFLKGGIFWGWPSSHTTVAFAMAFTAISLLPARAVKIMALIYALYIGLGVSITVHWFSDFAAGAILGTLVGVVVGKSFKGRLGKLHAID